jgi:hypothetical protein
VAQSEAEARKRARYWLKALGYDPDEMAKRYSRLAAGGSGRHKHPPIPHQFLAGIELFVRVAVRDRDGKYLYEHGVGKPRLTRKKAILWIAEAAFLPVVEDKAGAFLAASRDARAFASHLEKELRRNGFNKMPDKKLLPPGIDMKWLTLDIVHVQLPDPQVTK